MKILIILSLIAFISCSKKADSQQNELSSGASAGETTADQLGLKDEDCGDADEVAKKIKEAEGKMEAEGTGFDLSKPSAGCTLDE